MKIEDIESTVDIFEDEKTGEISMVLKRATIMFMDGSKLKLVCTMDSCEDKLDTVCVGINCEHYKAYDGKGNELKREHYDSKLLPQFIKRVWRSRKGKKRE